MVSSTVQQIAQQNDRFRQGDPNSGQRLITAGINELLKQLDIPPEELAQAVTEFSQFTEDNDPHGEHDFGGFEFHGRKCFWKIDYYDLDYHGGSDDPSGLVPLTFRSLNSFMRPFVQMPRGFYHPAMSDGGAGYKSH